MAKPTTELPVNNKHRWFNLQTTRGLIEALGAFVAVVGSAVGVYLQLFPKKGPDKTPEVPVISIPGTITAQNNSPVVIGSPHTTIQITRLHD